MGPMNGVGVTNESAKVEAASCYWELINKLILGKIVLDSQQLSSLCQTDCVVREHKSPQTYKDAENGGLSGSSLGWLNWRLLHKKGDIYITISITRYELDHFIKLLFLYSEWIKMDLF